MPIGRSTAGVSLLFLNASMQMSTPCDCTNCSCSTGLVWIAVLTTSPMRSSVCCSCRKCDMLVTSTSIAFSLISMSTTRRSRIIGSSAFIASSHRCALSGWLSSALITSTTTSRSTRSR